MERGEEELCPPGRGWAGSAPCQAGREIVQWSVPAGLRTSECGRVGCLNNRDWHLCLQGA